MAFTAAAEARMGNDTKKVWIAPMLSTASPTPSRGFEGPSSGNTR